MTAFIIAWLLWNTLGPQSLRFDPWQFIVLTLLLSLQASYAAPLILLAQNRQADRDRVQYQEDRARTERLIADTEYLTREIASLRVALGEVATRDFLRSELRDLLEDLDDRDRDGRGKKKKAKAAEPRGRSSGIERLDARQRDATSQRRRCTTWSSSRREPAPRGPRRSIGAHARHSARARRRRPRDRRGPRDPPPHHRAQDGEVARGRRRRRPGRGLAHRLRLPDARHHHLPRHRGRRRRARRRTASRSSSTS